MMHSVSVAEAKGMLSELIGRAAFGGDRIIIERRGRPVAAIVSMDDLARLEPAETVQEPRGLLAALGVMADIEDFDQIMDEVVASRVHAHDRDVDLE